MPRFEPISVNSSSRSVKKYPIRLFFQRIVGLWIMAWFEVYDALEPPRPKKGGRVIHVINGGRAAHPADG